MEIRLVIISALICILLFGILVLIVAAMTDFINCSKRPVYIDENKHNQRRMSNGKSEFISVQLYEIATD